MKTTNVPSQKHCAGCKEVKDTDCFGVDSARKDGLNPYCKECKREMYKEHMAKPENKARKASTNKQWLEENRERANATRRVHRKNNPDKMWAKYLRERYHLTPEQFEEILDSQNGVCAICKKHPEEGKRLVIDHDHACCPEKGKSCGECIRGLLCSDCNSRLGHVENETWLADAFQYLNKER